MRYIKKRKCLRCGKYGEYYRSKTSDWQCPHCKHGKPNPGWNKGLTKENDKSVLTISIKNKQNANPPGHKYIDSHTGYIYVKLLNGTYEAEHRLVMEKRLGRKLKSRDKEIVHHTDGNKLNNDPNNLRLTNLSEHMSHHKSQNTVAYWRGKNLPKYMTVAMKKRSPLYLHPEFLDDISTNNEILAKKYGIHKRTIARWKRRVRSGEYHVLNRNPSCGSKKRTKKQEGGKENELSNHTPEISWI